MTRRGSGSCGCVWGQGYHGSAWRVFARDDLHSDRDDRTCNAQSRIGLNFAIGTTERTTHYGRVRARLRGVLMLRVYVVGGWDGVRGWAAPSRSPWVPH